MPRTLDNRVRIFPGRAAAAAAADERRSQRFPKIVPDRLAGDRYAVRRDTYRGRAVFCTWLCEDGRFRYEDTCVW